MRPADLQALLGAETFRPFRLSLTDGRSYDVLRRDMIHLVRANGPLLYGDRLADPTCTGQLISISLLDRADFLD